LYWNRKKDVGLISTAGTIIVSNDWHSDPTVSAERTLHRLLALYGCRLSGFTLLYEQLTAKDSYILHSYDVREFCLEDCLIVKSPSEPPLCDPCIQLMAGTGDSGSPICLRRCLFDTSIAALSVEKQFINYLVDHNWWIGASETIDRKYILASSPTASLIIKENIIDVPRLHCVVSLQGTKEKTGDCREVYTGNTLLQPVSTVLSNYDGLPGRDVTITQNLWPHAKGVLRIPPNHLNTAVEYWTVQNNFGGDLMMRDLPAWHLSFIPAESLGEVDFLSRDLLDRNYARLDPQWVKSRFPDAKIIPGALPPGPAPETGDWLTQLQERYREIINSPGRVTGMGNSGRIPTDSKILSLETDPQFTAPTPLKEWLRDRKVLTVKQDGSAMYSTIQAALDAQQNGEVVEVLDRGPYRESLIWKKKNEAGLISNVGTIIDAENWKTNTSPLSEQLLHRFGELQNCRLRGFIFLYNQQDQNDQIVLLAHNVSGFCLEDAVFMNASPVGPRSEPRVVLYSNGKETVFVRACVFDTTLFAYPLDNVADYRIYRNWWIRSKPFAESKYALRTAHSTSWTVSENIFDFPGLTHLILLQGHPDQGANSRKTYTRNTVLQPVPQILTSTEELSEQAITITHNLWPFTVPVLQAPSPEGLKIQSHWKVQDNYGGKPGNFDRNDHCLLLATDKQRGEIHYLSTDPLNRNYARLDPQWIQRHFPEPQPEPQTVPGALPPGPAPEVKDWMDWLFTEYRLGRASAHAAAQARAQSSP